MYGKVTGGVGAAGGLAALADTGISIIWLLIGAVALIGLGGALLRFVPRREN
ncbi:hypothetical protein GCM10010123_36440 [Pilimelia anulata]|uniref:Uncharacterized protein n=1 Tax=Pilimelia anulata TaxID=53371 RepID=A0A8J3BDT8_9ACTN|nr:hypothetical protein [Pilimelia anulata]GGK03227.1 hypothetical protein GCM10010123_36440 [Pilimelia anulata]